MLSFQTVPFAYFSSHQVPPDNLTTVIHDTDSESDQSSPEVIKQHQDQQSDLGSVEQAVQHFQLASAKLFQEEDSDDQFCSPPVEQQNQMEASSEEESKDGQNNQANATESLMQGESLMRGEKISEAVEQQRDPAQAQPPMVAEDGSPANMELEESKEMTEQGEPVEVPAEEPAVPTEPLIPAEYEKLVKGCEENPEDFNGWVYLLQYVEQEVSVEKSRNLYVDPCIVNRCNLLS